MSLSDILGSALSGMNAAQAGLRSASNNIANVNTPGYAREQVSLQTGVTAGQVSGVRIGEPERVADRFLEANVYRRSGDWGRADTVATYLDRLQGMLGSPGDAGGLPARIDAIGAAAVALTGSAAHEQAVGAFVTSVEDAVHGMQRLDADAAALRTDVAGELGYTVDSINDLLRRIGTLNETVARQAAMGRASGGATDLRMTAVEQLSSLLKINVREGADGRLTIETAGGVTLVDRRLRQLAYPSESGVAQPIYPPITIRFAAEDGTLENATGEQIDSPAIGGKLGGLMELRDRLLPQFGAQLGTLFRGLSESLNAVSNAGSTVPAPNRLEGGNTGLSGSDRLGFTGRLRVAVTTADNKLAASAMIDFDALGPGATVDDAVAAINAGLGGAGSASFIAGRMVISASSAANGVAVAQDAGAPSDRAGIGFAHFFGLNDLIAGPGTITPTGFLATDPHGFAAGQSTHLALRDPTGRLLAEQTLVPSPDGRFADLLADLNGGPMGGFGDFSLDARGRLVFVPVTSIPTATIGIVSDSSDRLSTGRSFASLMGLPGEQSGLREASVRADIRASARRLPLARLAADAVIGERALGAGDNRGAIAFVDELRTPVDLGRGLSASVEGYASLVLGGVGIESAQASDRLTDLEARRSEAINRRDSFSGVNMDEELAQLVMLQNSYSAAARVMSTATQMYDTLLGMVQA